MKEIERKDLKQGRWYLLKRMTNFSRRVDWFTAQVEKISYNSIHLNHKIRTPPLDINWDGGRSYFFYKLPDLEDIVYNGGEDERTT